MKDIKMLKLLKMLKQLKNGYTDCFEFQVAVCSTEVAKGAINKGIEISSWDLKKARNVGDDQKWSVAADILLSEDTIRRTKCDQTLES